MSASLRLSPLSFFNEDMSDPQIWYDQHHDPSTHYDNIICVAYLKMTYTGSYVRMHQNIGGFLFDNFGARSPNCQIKSTTIIS